MLTLVLELLLKDLCLSPKLRNLLYQLHVLQHNIVVVLSGGLSRDLTYLLVDLGFLFEALFETVD